MSDRYAFGEYTVTFDAIDGAEKNLISRNQEKQVAHDNAVKQWDTLYEGMKALAEKYKDSEAFQDSQLYKRFFEPATSEVKTGSWINLDHYKGDGDKVAREIYQNAATRQIEGDHR